MRIFPWLAVTAFLVPFAAAGCSTSDDDDASSAARGTTTVTGSVGNLSIAAQSAVAIYGPLQNSVGEVIDGLIIDIADKDDSCAVFHTASTTILSLTFPSSPAAGTFTVINAEAATPVSSQVEVDISGTTATCADDGESASATGGTVTLTAVSASAVSGTFDVAFAAGSLKGTFTAPVCPVTTDEGGHDDGGVPACTP
jgi:hypothetical protein